MRAHADGLYCAQAAAELLIGHRVWLGRAEFVDRFVRVCAGWTGAVMAVVDWSGVVDAVDSGRLGCSGSEAAVLRIAASLAAGVAVDLGDALTGLDEANLTLVAQAVLRAGGRPATFSGADGRRVRP
ncbi:MAG TPA: hypothetical protein VHS30_03610 [Streptosporangiaceae bacterium]|nr:hypothetical protein [Streptosporangiaceae bacterium]